MVHHTRLFGLASAIVALALLALVETASAQVGWPCPAALVCNFSNCRVTLILNTTPPGVIPAINLAPGQCINIPTPVASIDQVVSAAGIAYPILPPPPFPLCNCLPNEWSVCCVTLPPQNCCFDVCFDPVACTININNAACPPGTCNP
jgi:hypothetical protein